MGRLDGLDGLRAIAALWIVLFHAVGGARSNAYLAVDFFFLLSGYVMARSFESRLVTGGAGEAWSFMKGRMRRLYPTVVLASLAGLPWLWHTTGPATWTIAVESLLLIPVGLAQDRPLNPPVWSVGYELLANALHGPVLARVSTRMLLGMSIVMLAALAIHTDGRGLDVTPGGINSAFTILRVLAPYCLGIALYRSWRDRPPFRVTAMCTWWLMPVFFVFGTLLSLENSPWDFVFVVILCPLLMAGGLQNGAGSRLASLGGAISFPLYAIHGPVLVLLKGMGFGMAVQLASAIAAGVALWLITTAHARFVATRPSPSQASRAGAADQGSLDTPINA